LNRLARSNAVRQQHKEVVMKARSQIKRILVPVDFSEPSREALSYALALAQPLKAHILLLHVVENVLPPAEVLVLKRQVLAARSNEDAAKRLAEWRREIASDVSVSHVLHTGVPDGEIVEVARTSHADLIVLGTHRRTGLDRLLMGSTAERVVRHACCAVLVVRQFESDRGAARRGKASRRPSRIKSAAAYAAAPPIP